MELTLRINRVMTYYKRYLNCMRESGICFENALVLHCVREGINKSSMISNHTRKDPSYTKRMLNKLVSEGLVEQRGYLYFTTPKGERVYSDISQLNRDLFANVDEDDSVDHKFVTEDMKDLLLKVEKALIRFNGRETEETER